MAELNQRRQTLWADAHARLRALIGGAVDVIEDAVRDGDLKAAIEVLKAVKLYGEVGAPTGATEPDVIVRQQAAARLEREGTPKNALSAMLENLDTAAYRSPAGGGGSRDPDALSRRVRSNLRNLRRPYARACRADKLDKSHANPSPLARRDAQTKMRNDRSLMTVARLTALMRAWIPLDGGLPLNAL